MQALALLNHRWFFECARALAVRVVRESPQDDRIDFVFRVCLGREPTDVERQILNDLLVQQRQCFANNTERAKMLIGESDDAAPINVREVAAWLAVTRTLLNLDEFITRE